ncbi:hypothetical protein [Hymenobacter sp. AT01-02]|uniref:hypothetical protein n=1 Tax=Hymenobacter sp. AT01-02 TaxID=1571877 RepID=UPI0013793ADB|nr:hypothetical protein [Hymenobacter sp. AT01-02]
MKYPRLLTLLVAVVVPSFCQAQGTGVPAVDIPQLMDSVALRLQQHYIFPEKAQRMGAYVQSQAKKNVYAALATDPKHVMKQLQADLQAAHHDPHVFVEYNPELAKNSRVSPQPNPEEMAQAKKYWKANNYLFRKVEVLPGNIGYFPFTGFIPDLVGAQPTISAALQFVANTNASSLICAKTWEEARKW